MSSFLQQAINHKLASPPAFLVSNLQYEVIMGSRAYSAHTPTSDYDMQGFAMPPKDVMFPHLAGIIPGFGNQGIKFEQYQQQKIFLPTPKSSDIKEVSFNIYNIVKYFQLCMDNNPNMIDSLFVPENCVTHTTQVGQLVRDNRRLFLSRKCWPKFKGYAFQQLHKLDNKKPEGNRLELVEKYGYDVKHAYNIVRLVDECEQILVTEDLDLQRAREQMKSVRRGEWTEQQLKDFFQSKLVALEIAYANCKLPEVPDESKLKRLLIECLEIHYGDLSKAIVQPNAAVDALREISQILERSRAVYGN